MFGYKIDGYNELMFNERENRAGAGILLLLGLTSFFNAFLLHNFLYTKIFVIVFMLDFFIRIFISPSYSPSLIIGRFFIRKQEPEYVSAEPKKFAWSIGLSLSIVMVLLIIVFDIMTPFKLLICLLCLTFLFFEASFGICIGCKIFIKFYNKKPERCPGGICNLHSQAKITNISKKQLLSLILFIVVIFSFFIFENNKLNKPNAPVMKCTLAKCGVGKCGM